MEYAISTRRGGKSSKRRSRFITSLPAEQRHSIIVEYLGLLPWNTRGGEKKI